MSSEIGLLINRHTRQCVWLYKRCWCGLSQGSFTS